MIRKILICGISMLMPGLSGGSAWAQGTGIGTSVVDPSAVLEIKSGKLGLLVPRVGLLNNSDKTTITNPATGLLLFNTSNTSSVKPGFYYNVDTPASPTWRSISELQIPYTKVDAADLLFSFDNNKGPVGTTLHLSNPQGYALKTEGKIQIAGNNQLPALGKELTSDAQGNATWEGGVAFRASGILGGGSEKLSGGVAFEETVPFAGEEYDLSGNYNNAAGSPNNVFIAPVKGVYAFNVAVCWDAGVDVSALVALTIRRLRAGVDEQVSHMYRDSGLGSMTSSTDLLLEPNDQVYVTIRHTHALKYITLKNPSFFTGKLMIRQ